MDILITYLTTIRLVLEKHGDSIPVEYMMEEICDIATNNWVSIGNPDLSQEQFDKVVIRVISRGTTLN